MADDEDETAGQAIARGIFWTAAVPFRLGFYATRLGYRAAKGAVQNNQIKKIKEAATPIHEASAEHRRKQLAALKAALPPLPPERMRATIQLNEGKWPIYEQRIVTGIVGPNSTESVPIGEKTRYCVDMILELPETDRAIIREQHLDDITLEEEPHYTQAEIQEKQAQREMEYAAARDDGYRAVYMKFKQWDLDEMTAQKRITTVGTLLASPYCRIFDTPHEAKEYAEKLKTELLPRVKELIDSYRDHKPSETVEF